MLTNQLFLTEVPEAKSTSPSTSRHASIDADQVTKDFVEFLKNLQRPGREIHKQCRIFLMNMSSKKVCCPQRLGLVSSKNVPGTSKESPVL